MRKSTWARTIGFVAAAGVTVALAGSAVAGTGAYFTDSKSGQINAATGGVSVSTTNLQMNFGDLLPGEFQTRTFTYTSHGTGQQDIWLVLPAGSADFLNGQKGTPAGVKALGRYGHFAVSGPDGAFTSYNLTAPPTGDPSTPCPTDQYGRGGSDVQAATTDDFPAYCPAPNAILLSYALNPGASGTASVTFGFTKLLKGPQSSPYATMADFKIVATQHGVFPNDPNN